MDGKKVKLTIESDRGAEVFEGTSVMFVVMEGERPKYAGNCCPEIGGVGACAMLQAALESCSRLVPAAGKTMGDPAASHALGGVMALMTEQFAEDVRKGEVFVFQPKKAYRKVVDDFWEALERKMQETREDIDAMSTEDGQKRPGASQDPLNPKSWKGRP